MSTTIISEATDARHDPTDEMAMLYLDAHPEVRNLFPSWAEDIEQMFEPGSLAWMYGITRGEVEVSGCVTVDDDGSARLERPTVELPNDNAGWHRMETSALVARLRALAADLNSVATQIEAGS